MDIIIITIIMVIIIIINVSYKYMPQRAPSEMMKVPICISSCLLHVKVMFQCLMKYYHRINI